MCELDLTGLGWDPVLISFCDDRDVASSSVIRFFYKLSALQGSLCTSVAQTLCTCGTPQLVKDTRWHHKISAHRKRV
jgi:hypothetical protein